MRFHTFFLKYVIALHFFYVKAKANIRKKLLLHHSTKYFE